MSEIKPPFFLCNHPYQECYNTPMNIEEFKKHLSEQFGEDEVDSFIEKFGEKDLKYFNDILEAKNKLLECSSLSGDEASTAVVEFIDNFSIIELGNIQDSFNGKYESLLEFATQLFDDCYAYKIPDTMRRYIDYQKFCDEIRYDYIITESGIVFCRN